MQVLTAYHTDVGNEKDTNEDSLCIQVAETGLGTAVLVAVCDGMGGLAKGEIASASVVRAMQAWFTEEFPGLLTSPHLESDIRYQWDRIIKEQNRQIGAYGRGQNVQLGTTMTVLLLLENRLLLVGHVGDTRAYRLGARLERLTEDHTVTNNEVRHGHMTPEEAKADARSHILVQCIGASKVLEPDFHSGRPQPGECYLLCSDGFRGELSSEEIAAALKEGGLPDEAVMEEKLKKLAGLAMQRGEKDNITAILVKIEKSGGN